MQIVLNVGLTHLCCAPPGPPPFGSSWVKRYCTFVKEQKILHMVTFDHRSGGKNVSVHTLSYEHHSFLYSFDIFNISFFFSG